MALSAAAWGDLLADPEREDTFYAVILADKQEFINAELTGAGHCTVHTACIDALPARLAESRERTLQEATVPSLRADAVLAAMLHTSRTRAAEYIAAGRVEINHLPLKAAHETAYAADIFYSARRGALQAGGHRRQKPQGPHLYHVLSVLNIKPECETHGPGQPGSRAER